MKLIVFCLLGSTSIFSAQASGSCAAVPGSCSQSSPCCSQFGFCGSSAAHCGAGCQQIGNFPGVNCQANQGSQPNQPSSQSSDNSQCRSGTFLFSPDRVRPVRSYNGDNQATDFTVDGNYGFLGSTLQLKMPGANQGSTLYSTRPVHFGRITAVLRTSRSNGVVSSFITRSSDLDEIDFEWVGGQLGQTQTNWFGKGFFPTWPITNSLIVPSPDTYSGFHSYTIDWNRDRIIWSINNAPIRTVYASNTPGFPTSPSRIELGIWDGGSNAEGTRSWAGGFIDWNSIDMRTQGFYDVQVQSISIQCY